MRAVALVHLEDLGRGRLISISPSGREGNGQRRVELEYHDADATAHPHWKRRHHKTKRTGLTNGRDNFSRQDTHDFANAAPASCSGLP